MENVEVGDEDEGGRGDEEGAEGASVSHSQTSTVKSAAGWVRNPPLRPGGLPGYRYKGRYGPSLAFYPEGESTCESEVFIGEAGEALIGAHLLQVFMVTAESFPTWLGLPQGE